MERQIDKEIIAIYALILGRSAVQGIMSIRREESYKSTNPLSKISGHATANIPITDMENVAARAYNACSPYYD